MKNNYAPVILAVVGILCFIYVLTLPKGHWFIGVWNWIMMGNP